MISCINNVVLDTMIFISASECNKELSDLNPVDLPLADGEHSQWATLGVGGTCERRSTPTGASHPGRAAGRADPPARRGTPGPWSAATTRAQEPRHLLQGLRGASTPSLHEVS